MARFSAICVLALIAFALFTSAYAGGEGSVAREDCPKECERRCAKASSEDCVYYCKFCCDKGLCVPSGTFGNKEECPCYNSWKTKKGTPKCP